MKEKGQKMPKNTNRLKKFISVSAKDFVLSKVSTDENFVSTAAVFQIIDCVALNWFLAPERSEAGVHPSEVPEFELIVDAATQHSSTSWIKCKARDCLVS